MREPARPTSPRALVGQVLLYATFALALGVFSQWPRYHPLAPGQAVIKVSFVHAGRPVGDCRPLTQEERARLPPNMRAPQVCPRERSPVSIEVDLGDAPVLRRTATPSGLSRDGASALYQKLVVPAGVQRIAVRLKDDVRAGGFTHTREATVTLAPAQVLVVDFDAQKGAITIQ
ncbi:MAG TPA: hypothetical protein VFQ16_00295 [Burkholderiaceae bacterium]|nr:hypothetical protein [Burkholderiaceae bacterium]